MCHAMFAYAPEQDADDFRSLPNYRPEISERSDGVSNDKSVEAAGARPESQSDVDRRDH